MTEINFQQPPDIKQVVMEKDRFSRIWFQWFTKLVQKLNAITVQGSLYVVNTRQINTTAPLAGGGNLAADLTISSTGESVTIVLAKLTGGGSDGSLTFTDGILTAHVDPT